MFALKLNVCSDVVNFKLNARKESKKVVLSSEARAALRSLLSPPSKKTSENPLNSSITPMRLPLRFRGHFSLFGGTENGTSDARIKILRPLL